MLYPRSWIPLRYLAIGTLVIVAILFLIFVGITTNNLRFLASGIVLPTVLVLLLLASVKDIV